MPQLTSDDLRAIVRANRTACPGDAAIVWSAAAGFGLGGGPGAVYPRGVEVVYTRLADALADHKTTIEQLLA